MDKDYAQALKQAEENLTDLKKRGNAAIGSSWEDFRKKYYTPEQIAESDFRVSIICEMIKARREKGLSQRQLEELTGVKQSAIARLEKGDSMPNISTLQKLLAPLGKKLAIVNA